MGEKKREFGFGVWVWVLNFIPTHTVKHERKIIIRRKLILNYG